MKKHKELCTCDQHKDFANPCCEDIKNMINDCKVGIIYDKIHKCFSIKRPYPYKSGSHTIQYCPWCGTKFPEELIGDDSYEHSGSFDPETLEMRSGPVKGRKP